MRIGGGALWALPAMVVLVMSVPCWAQAPAPAAPAPTAAPAPATGPTPLSVLVLNTDVLVNDSKAGKAVAQQLKAKNDELQIQRDKEHKEFQKEINDFNQQVGSGGMNREAAQRKERELAEKQQKIKERDLAVRDAFDAAANAALKKIQEIIVKDTKEIAQARKANLVLQRREIVLFDPSFEITDEVLQKMDQEMPTLTVNFVAPAAPAAPAPAPAAPAPKKKK